MRLFSKRDTVTVDNQADEAFLKALLHGTDIDRATALTIPCVSSSVDMICNIFATIPFKLYKESETEDGRKQTEEVIDERVRLINDDTMDTLDGFQFKKAMCEDYLLGKGGYAYIRRQKNAFKSLHYVEDMRVSITKNSDPIFKDFDIIVNGKSYKPYEFIKLLRNTKDGAEGKGVVAEVSKALQTAYQRLLYENDLMKTGGNKKGFLLAKKHLDKESMKALKIAWDAYFSGNSSTVILNDGMEFKEASNTSVENQLNERSKAFTDEIKDIFHIGPTYNDTIKNAIMPIATAFATALNRDFLLEKEKKSFYFAPDTKELFKGSMKERYEAYQIAIKNGFKSRNEIRYLEDDDYIEGLDIVNLGLGDVLLDTKTGQIYTPNTNKTVKMGESQQLMEGGETDADTDKGGQGNS